MSELNENHRRCLVATFQSIDALLSATLQAIHAGDSPLALYLSDMQPVQYKVLEDQLRELRAKMADILQREHTPIPPPQINGSWGFRTALMSARTWIEEIRPKYMQAYGMVSEDVAEYLHEAAGELLDQLDRMEACLLQPPAADLEARVARMDQAARNNRIAPLLAVLARIVKEELPYFRTTLAALLDRAERSDLEVAVFGRVCSGKSSLLDHILQTDLLPVGVTPVTSFPTRICYGSIAKAKVCFVGRAAEIFPPEALREFVTEQCNPDNERHVSRVELELPSPRLQGMAFVDTPGLGSLARRGVAETLAYLPRCDLGLVLVDSTATLLPDDLGLIDALSKAGAETMVLLTKADILSPSDRMQLLGYVKERLRDQLAIDLPVHFVSVRETDADLSDRWVERVLTPRRNAHQQCADDSLARKVEVLYAGVLYTLEARLQDTRRRHPAGSLVEGEWRMITAKLESCRRRKLNDLKQIEQTSERIFERIAADLATTATDEDHINAAIRRIFSETVLFLSRQVRDELADLRSLILTVSHKAGFTSMDDDDVPAMAAMPLPPECSIRVDAPLSLGIVRWRGPRGKTQAIRHQLAAMIGYRLEQTLKKYFDHLESWRLEALEGLRREFQSRSDRFAARFRTPSGAVSNAQLDQVHRNIEELRRVHEMLFTNTGPTQKIGSSAQPVT